MIPAEVEEYVLFVAGRIKNAKTTKEEELLLARFDGFCDLADIIEPNSGEELKNILQQELQK